MSKVPGDCEATDQYQDAECSDHLLTCRPYSPSPLRASVPEASALRRQSLLDRSASSTYSSRFEIALLGYRQREHTIRLQSTPRSTRHRVHTHIRLRRREWQAIHSCASLG